MPVGTPTKRSRWTATTSAITAITTDVALLAAHGTTGVRIVVTKMSGHNSGVGNSRVAVKEGTTVLDRHSLQSRSGFEAAYSETNPLQLTANTALNVATEVVTSSGYVSAQGYYEA